MNKLSEEQKTELLDWVSACQSAYHIDNTPGHRFGGVGSNVEENRAALVEYVDDLFSSAIESALASSPAVPTGWQLAPNALVNDLYDACDRAVDKGYGWHGLDELMQKVDAAYAEQITSAPPAVEQALQQQQKFMDETDAAKAGEAFLDKVQQSGEYLRLHFSDDGAAQAPRLKWAALFDNLDNLRAAYLLTRDMKNWTQLTTIDAVSAVEQADAAQVRNAALEGAGKICDQVEIINQEHAAAIRNGDDGSDDSEAYVVFSNRAVAAKECGISIRALQTSPQPAKQEQPKSSVAPTLDDEAKQWAWEQVRREVGTDGWTVGDNCNYYGFFDFGWRYHAQLERQRQQPVSSALELPLPEPEFYVWMDAFNVERMGRKAPEHRRSRPYFSTRQLRDRDAMWLQKLQAVMSSGERDKEDMQHKLQQHSIRVGEAVSYWKGQWPENLISGVMYFNGERILKNEFIERADIADRAAQGESNG